VKDVPKRRGHHNAFFTSSYDPYDDSSDYSRRPRHSSSDEGDDGEGAAFEHAEWLRRRALGLPYLICDTRVHRWSSAVGVSTEIGRATP
jgi:hypothetical protein